LELIFCCDCLGSGAASWPFWPQTSFAAADCLLLLPLLPPPPLLL
jgi:hypothetical protein